MSYEDNMSNFLTAFSDQLKYIRDDIASMSKSIEGIKSSVSRIDVQVARIEQHNADRTAMCESHGNSVNELYGRMNTVELNVSHITTRFDESIKQSVAVEKAEQKYNEWLKWLAPYLWKFALTAGAIIAAFQFWMKYEARVK